MTSPEEQIANYELQLEQVNSLLVDDPVNSEFLELKTDLENIIKLLTEQKTEKSPLQLQDQSISDPLNDWKIGDSCEIKDSAERWIPGEVQNISADRTKFNVKVKENNIEKSVLVTSNGIRRPKAKAKYFGYIGEVGKKAKENRDKRIKQKEKFNTKKETEQSNKTQTWQSFQSRISKSKAPTASFFANPHKSVYKKPDAKKL